MASGSGRICVILPYLDPHQEAVHLPVRDKSHPFRRGNLYNFVKFIGSYSGTFTVVVIDYISTIEKLKSAIFLGLLLSDFVQ